MFVYVSIGNSDDKLTQAEWSEFVAHVGIVLRQLPDVATVHGQWLSEASWPWQNACWCIEIINTFYQENITKSLGYLAHKFRQDSIAWAEVEETYFIKPSKEH